MTSTTVKISNEEGLHARPAGILAKTAGKFQSKVEIHFNGQTKNAKSIMSIMSLGLQFQDEITLQAEGPDEVQALAELTQLVNAKFARPEE